MGIFSKLFGKGPASGDAGALVKTGRMMDEDQFWKLVADSLHHTNDQEEQEEWLVTHLQQLSPAEMIGFRLRTDKLLYDTYTGNMWCAAYIMNGGCSDDGFEYFRCWLISRGKKTYYNAKENPDSLADIADEETEYDFEGFWQVALTAFENKTGKDLYDYIDDDNFKFTEGNYPPIQFAWKEEEPDTMQVICPKLFHKMWH